jgi:hypothetical protein
VLCEKPFTLNALELNDLVQYAFSFELIVTYFEQCVICLDFRCTVLTPREARAKKLYLSEAMWMRYFPAVKKVKELITNGSLGKLAFTSGFFILFIILFCFYFLLLSSFLLVGEIKSVNGTFGFQLKKEAVRLSESDLGGGALVFSCHSVPIV